MGDQGRRALGRDVSVSGNGWSVEFFDTRSVTYYPYLLPMPVLSMWST